MLSFWGRLIPSNQPASLPRKPQAHHYLSARPAFRNILVLGETKRCKGNKFQKSSAEGNVLPSSWQWCCLGWEKKASMTLCKKTDLGMLNSINQLQLKIRSARLTWTRPECAPEKAMAAESLWQTLRNCSGVVTPSVNLTFISVSLLK